MLNAKTGATTARLSKTVSPTVALIYLGMIASIQGSDPNIASTALLSAGKDLNFGNLTALAASVSTLALAATVISTGMMADRWGRKKVISAAMLLAIVGDVLVSLSPDALFFIAGRAITGVALGALYGAAFAYVKLFGENSKGGLAASLGTFSAAVGLFTLLMTFAGSSLVGVGWREAFLVVPVLSALGLLLGLIVLPRDTVNNQKQPWDGLGQLLLGLAVIFSLYGISHAANGILTALTIIPIALGLLLFVLFYVRERRSPDRRFFPIALLKEPLFLAAIGVGFLYNFSTGSGLLTFSNLFQYQLNLKGLELSLSQLPYLVIAIPVALIIGRLVSRSVVSRQLSALIGSLVSATGAAIFAVTALSQPETVLSYVPALLILGIGAAIPAVAYGGMILEEADARHYGVVSSSRTTIGQFWYSLGLASSTIIIDSITRTHVVSQLGSSAEQQLVSWSASGAKPTDASVLPTAIDGFTEGFASFMVIYAVLMVLVGVVVLILGNVSDKRSQARLRNVSLGTNNAT